MRIGYPCINLALKNPCSSTFRLKSYSEKRFNETVKNNLDHLLSILIFNKKNNIYFFRISSDIIPFASHPICNVDWSNAFEARLSEIGNFIEKNGIRVSMHPDQFVILNSNSEVVIENSIRELQYHCKLLESMNLTCSAKIQIHGGGAYGDKAKAKRSFIDNFNKLLEENLKDRLVIENDDRTYALQDCLDINKETGIPIVFDTFHHECLNNGETIQEALSCFIKSWKYPVDGNPIIDYSSQSIGERKGKHTKTLNPDHFISMYEEFKKTIKENQVDLDVMLEIKDKEKSALSALEIINTH
ncbi:MAG: UV DNA damage repair endonuclease UvsE [Thermoproteota archaeon]|nr:UV DNA damage repair endonuclease UvsE [Thermoproteota archaeon]